MFLSLIAIYSIAIASSYILPYMVDNLPNCFVQHHMYFDLLPYIAIVVIALYSYRAAKH